MTNTDPATGSQLGLAAARARDLEAQAQEAVDARDALIRQMRAEGSTLREIAALSGISVQAVSKQLKRS